MEYASRKVIDVIHPVSRLHRKDGHHEHGERVKRGKAEKLEVLKNMCIGSEGQRAEG